MKRMLFGILSVAVLERFFPIRRIPIFRNGFVSDLGFYAIIQPQLISYAGEHLPTLFNGVGTLATRPFWLRFAASFLVFELGHYLLHRAAHRWDFLWAFHEVHHSSTQIDWLAGARSHAVDTAMRNALTVTVFSLVGTGPEIAGILGALNVVFGAFQHANIRLKTNRLSRYLLMTPDMHRLHHLNSPRHQRSNYGNTITALDWLFGTAAEPEDRLRDSLDYGTGTPYPQFFWGQNIQALRNFREALRSSLAAPT